MATREQITIVKAFLEDVLNLLHAMTFVIVVENKEFIWLIFVNVELGEDFINLDVGCWHTHCIFDMALKEIRDRAKVDQQNLGIVCFSRRKFGRVESSPKCLNII